MTHFTNHFTSCFTCHFYESLYRSCSITLMLCLLKNILTKILTQCILYYLMMIIIIMWWSKVELQYHSILIWVVGNDGGFHKEMKKRQKHISQIISSKVHPPLIFFPQKSRVTRFESNFTRIHCTLGSFFILMVWIQNTDNGSNHLHTSLMAWSLWSGL